MEFREMINAVAPPDETARQEARDRWNRCAKPLGSLGLLERAIEDVAALTGSADIDFGERAALVLCADNGVVRQGVTQTGYGVTAAVARQLALNRTAVCRMASVARCRVVPVDMGIMDFPGFDGVLERRIGNGTADFTEGPAMSREQAERAILTGVELVRDEVRRGTRLLALGEMGIGNTTTASAVVSVLLSRSVQDVTDRGSGLSDEALERKIKVIRRGVSTNRPAAWDSVDVLAKVGGFDLAGLCGACLGAALYRVPVILDGFPSTAAALCAVRLCPNAAGAMLASHLSAQNGGALVLKALGKQPLITAQMRLGEGTGAVAAIPLLDMALAVYRDAYTFAEGGIEPYEPQC